MKDLKLISSLLTLVLIAAGAVGQDATTPATNDLPARSEISMRRRYTQAEGIQLASNNDKELVQLPRRGPGISTPPRRGYYRGNYSSPWRGSGEPGHALIGAGIGFGIGATIGAIGGARTGTSGQGAILGGAIFGLIGAAIGASHIGPPPFMHRRRFDRPSWPQDDEEGTRRSHSKRTEDHAERPITKQPVAPNAANIAQSAGR